MPNPNFSELELLCTYGETEGVEEQTTRMYSAVSEDSDQLDHKYVHNVTILGYYVELAHYTAVKQFVIQNIGTDPGYVMWFDSVTGALVPEYLTSKDEISFCLPDVALGVWIYSEDILDISDWHIVLVGSQ